MNNNFKNIAPLLFVLLAGVVSLIFQVVSINIVFLFIYENFRAVGLSVSAFLAGLGVSSLLFGIQSAKSPRANEIKLASLLIVLALYGFLVLSNYQWVPEALSFVFNAFTDPDYFTAFKYLLIWIYLFIPALFIGALFPICNDLYGLPDPWYRKTAVIYASDLFGSVIGALLCGFVLLPLAGVQLTILLAAGSTAVLGIYMLKNLRVQALIACVFLSLFWVKRDHFIKDPMRHVFGDVLFQTDSPFGRITVGGRRETSGYFRTLYNNYRSLCSEVANDSERELASYTGNNLKPGARVLVIGLGCGFTLDRLVTNQNIEKITMVEINPAMPAIARDWFSASNHNAMNAPKVNIVIQDGAEFIRNTKEVFDAVIIDVEEVNVIYSSPLFTRELFYEIQTHLKSEGVFALWSFKVNAEFSRVLDNTLRTIFPSVEFRLRKTDYDIIFFAALRKLTLPPMNASETKFAKSMSDTKIHEVNSLDFKALAKHYKASNIFGLPEGYTEKFFIK